MKKCDNQQGYVYILTAGKSYQTYAKKLKAKK